MLCGDPNPGRWTPRFGNRYRNGQAASPVAVLHSHAGAVQQKLRWRDFEGDCKQSASTPMATPLLASELAASYCLY